jgi:hypothetical protein
MALARIVVCEKTGRWAVALRRELAAPPVRVYETRSLAECRSELEQSPASFMALEVSDANAVQLGEWIERANREFPLARFVVLGSREARPWEWQMREAGAIAAAFSSRQLGPIARLARRRLASVPEEELSFRDQVERRLPWANVGRGASETR